MDKVWKHYPKGINFYQCKGAGLQEIRMKSKSENDCQTSDFWFKLDLNIGLFFIINFSYFFYDRVSGEEMSLLVPDLEGVND